MATKFYVCPICGNVIMKIVDSGVTPMCCRQPMELLVPHKSENEQGLESHLPVVTRIDKHTIKVAVGAKMHPSSAEHRIVFVYLKTADGGRIHYFSPDTVPEVTFCCHSVPMAVYAYCNIHGLWMVEVPKSPCHDETFNQVCV